MAGMEMRESQRRYRGELRAALSLLRSVAPRLLDQQISSSMLPERQLLSSGGSPP
ncbi:hypothetical protein VSH64_19525 [Amycolatopsis rhabdoformis]|uniref:Uncharacterized protein n=1 Tax=Amycolatopsis rhabdoformis TaxID=1448059 RepID=A0ABZ1IK53_9PSEU|nr:hypothetical protein [Amycolatopsis rhabdoformis]WSE34256.1 hypothetical protein VSH64_19525 [Amycolatopsis rhabdoformis]